MTGKIIICEALDVLKIMSSQPIAAILSIEHPGVQPGEIGYAPRVTNVPQKILTFWDSEQKGTVKGPDQQQVEDGLMFALEHVKKGDIILHCKAGRARSAGMALGLLSLLHPRENETQLIDRLLTIRPQSAPNIIVVELIDQLTGRQGKLLQAVLDHSALTKARTKSEEARQRWIKRNPDKARQLFPEKFPPAP